MYRPRRLVAAIAATTCLTGALAACGGDGDTASSDDEIVLGVIGPQSGPQAEIGENQVAGAQVAADLLNQAGGVDGKKIRIVDQDEQGTPETASAAIRSLANDGVTLQMGMLFSSNCLAVAPTLANLDVTMVGTGCTNDGLTGQGGDDAPFPNFYRVNSYDSLLVKALGDVIAEKFPEVTDYTAFGYDYVTGRSGWDIFQKTLEADGVDLSADRETFVPLDEQNFRTYVSSLAADSGDKASRGLYLGLYGGGTAGFLQQAQDFDLLSKYAVTTQPGGYYPIARTLNGQAPNVWNAYDYSYAAFDNEMNDDFVSAFEEKTGKKPVSWSYDAYLGVLAYAAAIEKAGSTESSDVLAALGGLTFEAPSGTITLDGDTHQADTPVVVFDSVGDPSAPEGVKILDTSVVDPDQG